MKYLLGIMLFSVFHLYDAFCQTDDLLDRLDNQLSAYYTSFGELMIRRDQAMSAYRPDWVDHIRLQTAIEDYNQFPNTNRQSNSEMAGVIFYSFSSDTLYEWLLTYKGIGFYSTVNISPEELTELERDIKCSFSSGASVLAYVREKRGAEIDKISSDTLDYEYYNKKICNVLFPEALMQAISENDIFYINIIPALNIASFPLYCLRPYGNSSYLIDSLCINIGFSVDHFIDNTGLYIDRGLGPNSVFSPLAPLLIGNPSIGFTCKNSYLALPGAESEVKKVAALLGTKAFTGKTATKDTLLKLLHKSDFIYLATHGYADTVAPLKSFVLLASDNGDSCEYWTAGEIQNDTMTEDIVVLSACQTGLGMTHTAGIIGLSRAFIIAKAGNVVMSLWNVDDSATKDLMLLFVKELFIEHDFFPAANLRQAMLEYKKTDDDPAHWGAFISMGYSYPPVTAKRMEIKSKINCYI